MTLPPEHTTVISIRGASVNRAYRRGERWFAADYAGELPVPETWFILRDDSMERFEAFKATLTPAPDLCK